jgi:hypothetical protein
MIGKIVKLFNKTFMLYLDTHHLCCVKVKYNTKVLLNSLTILPIMERYNEDLENVPF